MTTPHKLVVLVLVLSSRIIQQQSLANSDSDFNNKNVSEARKFYRDQDGQETELNEEEDVFTFPFDTRRVESARNRWQQTFREIKTLAVPTNASRKKRSMLQNTTVSSGWFNRWKRFLKEDYDETEDDEELSAWNLFFSSTKSDTPSKWGWKRKHTPRLQLDPNEPLGLPKKPSKINQRARFDGVTTWDNLLQQWADDAAEYLSSIGNYTSTRPLSSLISLREQKDKSSTAQILEALFAKTQINATQKIKKTTPSFQPRPVLPGEPILPHTDISDRSKNIWIVTTAALPWMTGTAVNPLLRAAYLCEARWNQHSSDKNHGNVTLMIPWLEKQSDRDKLYGKKYSFQTCHDQETFIRSWLRNSANMSIASDHLFIEWYVGWLEPLENSVYSMGDITGQIPVERADICVLEEPEHLNWYRAPGESWTRKFKHVVGIVHTNYFVYAQDQPAALIRVRWNFYHYILLILVVFDFHYFIRLQGSRFKTVVFMDV
jgi:hypothetical protein